MTLPSASPFAPKILTTIREGYGLADLARDAAAGLSVAIVAVPLAIAIAIASGATPQVGLVTVVVAGLLISLLGGSRTQIGGPTAAFIVVVYGVVHTHGFDGLLTATLLAGAILVVAALCRVGSLVRHVPEPVIRGFTIGIAVVIVLGQLKDIFGLSGGEVPAEFFERFAALWEMRQSFNPLALGVAALTVAAIVLLRRFAPKLPGLVIAVLVATLLVAGLGLPVETIASRFGALEFAIPAPALPDLSPSRVTQMLPSAFVIAFLAGIESLLSAMIADRLSGGRHRPNTEMLAQGAANLGSALFGGLPATGAIARTATNIRAGGRTPVAGVLHALFVLVFALFFAPLLGHLPLAALGAVLLVAAWSMSEPHRIGADLSGRREDAAVLLLTLGLTVLFDLTLAITVGVAVALFLRLRRRNVPPPDWRPPER